MIEKLKLAPEFRGHAEAFLIRGISQFDLSQGDTSGFWYQRRNAVQIMMALFAQHLIDNGQSEEEAVKTVQEIVGKNTKEKPPVKYFYGTPG